MSRELDGIELGLNIFETNGDLPASAILVGSGVPGADAAEQDAAPVPSLYFRTGTSEIYRKIASANANADWELLNNTAIDQLSWRNEKVRFATDDTLAAGNVDITTLTDNESLVIGDITVGEYVIGDRDGVPALFEITALPGGNQVTLAAASQAIANNDTFIVQQYLPDSPGTQEVQAILHFPLAGAAGVKIGDVNFAIATGINLSPGYVAAVGNVVAGDTVEAAIAKLDGVNDSQDTLLGATQGDTDLGTFTGDIITDNNSVKGALQDLETELVDTRDNVDDLIALSGLPENSTDLGTFTGATITDNTDVKTALQELELAVENVSAPSVGPADIAQNTPTVIDTVLVDEVQSVKWYVTAHDIGDPTKVQTLEITGLHNGHAGADAVQVKDIVNDKFRIGGNFNLQVDVVLAGSGAAQTMGLQIETSDADGIRYTVSRAETVPAL